MIAALLPLPQDSTRARKGKSVQADTEAGLDRQMEMVDQEQYANARWWRNLNRVMSVVGLLVIGVVVSNPIFISLSINMNHKFTDFVQVALIVIALRMRNKSS